MTDKKQLLANKLVQLDTLSPTQTMLRGYSIIEKDDKIITSKDDLSVEDEITVNLKDGKIKANVKEIRWWLWLEQTFEEMMTELEKVVGKLDEENISLEESIELYQRGIELSSKCETKLKEAEDKVNKLVKKEGDSNESDNE